MHGNRGCARGAFDWVGKSASREISNKFRAREESMGYFMSQATLLGLRHQRAKALIWLRIWLLARVQDPRVSKTIMRAVAHDDVIEDADPQETGALDESLGQRVVVRARRGIAAWVVMGEENAAR